MAQDLLDAGSILGSRFEHAAQQQIGVLRNLIQLVVVVVNLAFGVIAYYLVVILACESFLPG